MTTIPLELQRVCDEVGSIITGITHDDVPVPGGLILRIIAGLESSFGQKREYVRHEKAFMPGGKYYDQNEPLRALYLQYGVLAASSFGTFQLMFITARELGFRGHPMELQQDRICAYWATSLIVDRFIRRKAKTLRDILDAYNSGAHADKFIPSLYIDKGLALYHELRSH